MTEQLYQCEQSFLRIVRAMQLALKEASGENAPPLPPLLSTNAVSSSSVASSGNNNNNIDTAIQRRQKWELNMKDRLEPKADEVKDACAALHHALGDLSNECLDLEACERAKKEMMIRTASLEQEISSIYSQAARTEERLMKELEKEAQVQSSSSSSLYK